MPKKAIDYDATAMLKNDATHNNICIWARCRSESNT